MIQRAYAQFSDHMKAGRVLLLVGPRRVGKTTLLTDFLSKTPLKYKLSSGDDVRTQQCLGSRDFRQILDYVSGYELLAIDEAQGIPDVGMGLKIIVDQRPDIQVIATGSSSFDLIHQTGEPLTGRKRTLVMYPLSQQELRAGLNPHEVRERLEEFLVFGSYPEIVTAPDRKQKTLLLNELANAYLLKDVLAMDRVRGPKALWDLLKLLAFQVGSEVSLNELATQVGHDVKTIGRYLDLLEKTFVIRRVGAFSRNLRNEVTGKQKFYFVDNGIRNAVVSQFNELPSRNDVGALWENFVVMERLKKREYEGTLGNAYFWRTYEQQEIDWVEELGGQLTAYECKWNTHKTVKPPASWQKAYPSAAFHVITPGNYLDWVA